MRFAEPFQFKRGPVAKNGSILAALTNKQSNADGTLSQAEIGFLERRAMGGFGIITTAATHVAENGQGWHGEMGVWSDSHIPGLKELAKRVSEHGSLCLAQIFHGGLKAPQAVTGVQPVSASVNEIKDGKFTRELSNDEVEEMVEKFVEAALRCEKAGLDGVEIHGAHGYLVSQFLGKKSNRRTDQWGGETIGDRATFLLEIIRRIRERTNKNFLIFVRISPELNDIGIEIDEALQLSSILSEEEIDSLHISVWDIYAQSRFDDDDRKMTQRFAQVVDGRVPLTTCGKIWEGKDIEEAYSQGADLIAVGKVGIALPDWPKMIISEDRIARPPFTKQHLRDVALSEVFVDYMCNYDNFVAQ
tara:strand:+ start:923 stop:2002 length:1080 start_codon:yes stop_codon:yes gene_type:complete